jgi:hypothetical protein
MRDPQLTKTMFNDFYAIRTSAVPSITIQPLLYYCVPNLKYLENEIQTYTFEHILYYWSVIK